MYWPLPSIEHGTTSAIKYIFKNIYFIAAFILFYCMSDFNCQAVELGTGRRTVTFSIWQGDWQEVILAYRRGWLKKSLAGWLFVHRGQLRAYLSVTSTGELYLYLIGVCWWFHLILSCADVHCSSSLCQIMLSFHVEFQAKSWLFSFQLVNNFTIISY